MGVVVDKKWQGQYRNKGKHQSGETQKKNQADFEIIITHY